MPGPSAEAVPERAPQGPPPHVAPVAGTDGAGSWIRRSLDTFETPKNPPFKNGPVQTLGPANGPGGFKYY
ncbi:hypothetical protein F1880_004890 [Penicillium rolfsii]|nr:hypothetical protein F1880_004890 [Penicillium rolfsii]